MKRHGFTLVELIVVMAIIAMVASLGTPALMKLTGRRRLHAVSRELAAILQDARQHAVSQRQQVAVRIDLAAQTVTVQDAQTGSALRRVYHIPESVQWARLASPESDPITFEDDTIIFLPTGGLQGPGGSVYMSLPNDQGVEVSVAQATGQARINPQ